MVDLNLSPEEVAALREMVAERIQANRAKNEQQSAKLAEHEQWAEKRRREVEEEIRAHEARLKIWGKA